MTKEAIIDAIDAALATNSGTAATLTKLRADLLAADVPPVVVPPPPPPVVEPPPVVVPPPPPPPPVVTDGAVWRAVAPVTAVLPNCPPGPYKNIWIVGAKDTKAATWWAWPKSGNMGTIAPTHTGTTLSLLAENKTAKPVVYVEVTVLWPDGTSRVWNINWNGDGATAWPVYGIGTRVCPVVSVMQHEGLKPVTSQFAHLIKGVIPGQDFESVNLDIGFLKESAPDGLEVQYLIGGLPVTGWLAAKACAATITLDDVAGIKNGVFDLTFNLRGPGAYRFAPHSGQILIHRPGAVDTTSVYVGDDAIVTQDPTNIPPKPGYAYVNPATLAGMGPMTVPYSNWTGVPPVNMRVTALTPCSKLFENVPMLWDSRVNGKPYMRSFPPKHDEAPKSLNPEFTNSPAQPPHATLPTCDQEGAKRWLSNYAQFAGIPGGGWVTSDPGGAVCLVERSGKFTVIAGWRVRHDRYPIWPFAGKSVAKIRDNMEFRSTGDMKPEMICTLTDISIDPVTKTRAVAPDYKNHVVWLIDWSAGLDKATTKIIAGQFGKPGYQDGTASLLNGPMSASFSPSGISIVIADQNNDALRIASLGVGSVGTPYRSTRLRAKFGPQTPPWEIRPAAKMTGDDFDLYAPQFVRWCKDGSIVFSDLGTSTIRRVAQDETVSIVIEDNLNLGKSGWSAFDVDDQGGIYFVNFTGTNIDQRTGTTRSGALNEAVQYIDATGKRHAIFTGFWGDPLKPATIGNGTADRVISPHYPWGCWKHPNGPLAVNGAGTHGTLILTPMEPSYIPATHNAYNYEFYMAGDPPRANPPQFSLGPMASWIAPGVTEAKVAAAYPDWHALTDAERLQLFGTIQHFHRR